MKTRTYFWGGICTIMLIVCVKTPLVWDLFSVLIFGMIPGTDVTVPTSVMLVCYPLLVLLAVAWLSAQSLFVGEQKKPVPKQATKAKRTSKKKPTSHQTVVAKRRARGITA